MYQATGWLVIRHPETEDELDQIRESVREVQRLIDSYAWQAGTLDLRAVNGEYFLSLVANTNHRGQEALDVADLLRSVASAAPESYGLVYEWDDEAQSWPGGNAFKAIVLANGEITERGDPFLSPTEAVIEPDYPDHGG
ncbi:Imm7 family immunity protein [Nonomuraea sp. NPDC048916]|uniref:Imm7 family immunity protein n=1 Tax=Nonomuraea sp. NPDC048916 TaxID=3154232 RepID=UPI0033E70EFC